MGLNKNICEARQPYSIFQKGILKRKLFRGESEVVLNLSSEWNSMFTLEQRTLKREEAMKLPKRITANYYYRYFTVDKQENKEYYLWLETIGGSFHVKMNGTEVAFGNGKQRFYEIRLTDELRNGVNTLAIQFSGEGEIIWEDAKFFIRPKKHIQDYNFEVKYIDEYKLHVNIDVLYYGEKIDTTCLIVAPKGKNIKKITLKNGKASFEMDNQELWDAEECKHHTIIFMTEEETIAQKVPIYFSKFKDRIHIVNMRAVHMRMVNWRRCIGVSCDTLLRSEIIEKFSKWKQRNINSIYVHEEMENDLLWILCHKYGFYYVHSTDVLMVSKEQVIDRNGKRCQMTRSYIPMKVWTLDDVKGMYAMKSEMDFANMSELYYVKISTYHKGKRIGSNVKYILDFKPDSIETCSTEWFSQIKGEIKVKIEFYQRHKTELVPKNHLYGVKEILFYNF